jgi:hypothetical protein
VLELGIEKSTARQFGLAAAVVATSAAIFWFGEPGVQD